MISIAELISDKRTLLIFEHLTVEVHLWEIVHDSNGGIETWKLAYANPPALRTWGQPNLESIKGKTTDEIFGKGATKHYKHVVEKIIAEGSPYSYQDYFPNIDRYFHFTSVPLGDYFVTTGADITDIVLDQQRIEEQNQLLELRVQQRTEELESTVATLHHALEESKRLREELRELAIHDPLTNLYNRRYLDEAIARELKRCARSGYALGVIFIDIDKFKEINDQFGHELGDIALREVSAMVQKTVRGSDIVCRFGGDEIVIIMPETSLEQASHKAQELCGSINTMDWDQYANELQGLTISLGVAAYPNSAESVDQLLNKADTALLKAKELGRNCVVSHHKQT